MDERQKLFTKAVVFLRQTDGQGLVSQKIAFLREKGLTDDEVYQAIAAAADPDVAKTVDDVLVKAKKEQTN